MTGDDRLDEVRRYLSDLDTALQGVPEHTAGDLRAAVEEELASLDADAARDRIAQLGDPAFIAAEARGETRVHTAGRKAGRESRAYVIVAALAIAVGGYIVPVVGALVGYAMVWLSRAWKRWEKVVATSVPVAVGLVTSAFLYASGSAGFAWWNVLIALSIANLGVAVWLLVRALRRS